MLSVVAKWSMLSGRRDQALAALKILALEVQREEPFVLMYSIHVPHPHVTSFPTPSECEVLFFSVFTDLAAFKAHLDGPVFRAWMDQYSHLFLTKNDDLFVISEFLDRATGFVRTDMVSLIS
jgi:quinol monooxygenase YgiN